MSSKASKIINRIGVIGLIVSMAMITISGGDASAEAQSVGQWIGIASTAVLGLWELARTIYDRLKE